MSYKELKLKITPSEPWRDIITEELGRVGFDSFDTSTNNELLAYIPADNYKEIATNLVLNSYHNDCSISTSIKNIKKVNWNEEWEKNFLPLLIGNKCGVRATFHESLNVPYEIVINPKMSFGTGHHETTHLMMQHCFDIDFKNKLVLDMGCGTGILAILAEKLNAKKLLAIDIDEWACENSEENIELNNCSKIEIKQGDASKINEEQFDIILANINRNIILSDLSVYASSLYKKGMLFISGILLQDIELVKAKALELKLIFLESDSRNKWAWLKFEK